jgi:hypothetical protein
MAARRALDPDHHRCAPLDSGGDEKAPGITSPGAEGCVTAWESRRELVARPVPMFSLTIEPSSIGWCLGCRDVREDVPNGKFTTWRIWPQWRDRKAISSLFAMRCGHNSFLVVRARERAMHPGRLDV